MTAPDTVTVDPNLLPPIPCIGEDCKQSDRHPKFHFIDGPLHGDCVPADRIAACRAVVPWADEWIDAAHAGVHGAELDAVIEAAKAAHYAANPAQEG